MLKVRCGVLYAGFLVFLLILFTGSSCSVLGISGKENVNQINLEEVLFLLGSPDESLIATINSTPQTPSAAGDLIISELQFNPAGPENLGEWIELYNPMMSIWNLEGCVLDESGGGDHTIGSELLVAPGGYAVLATTSPIDGFEPDYNYNDSLRWSNVGETATLACKGIVIDVLDYSVTGFPDPAGYDGVAISLNPDSYSVTGNDLGSNWCHATTEYAPGQKGSPGAANPDC